MRIFAYLGFLIVWLLAPGLMAITMADTPVQAVVPDGTQPPQPPEEDLLNTGAETAITHRWIIDVIEWNERCPTDQHSFLVP